MAIKLNPKFRQFRCPIALWSALAVGGLFCHETFNDAIFAQETKPSNSTLDDLFNSSEIQFSPIPLATRGNPQSGTKPRVSNQKLSPMLTQPAQTHSPQPAESAQHFLVKHETPKNPVDSNSVKMVVPLQSSTPTQLATEQSRTSPAVNGTIRRQFEPPIQASQVSFQERVAPVQTPTTQHDGATQTNRDFSNNSNWPSTNGSHQLQNVSSNQFESALESAYGLNMASSSSPDGRYRRVELPNRINQRMAMLIDRQSGLISYEGDAALQSSWSDLVSQIDSLPIQRADGFVVHTAVVDPGRADFDTIHQATFLMGMLQDDTQPGPDGLSQATLPAGSPIPQDQEILPGGPGAAQGIKDKVKILQDPKTGALTLIGSAEDIAIVMKIIQDIAARSQANQAEVKRIPLQNIQSEAVEEQIQELYDSGYASSKGDVQISAIPSPNSLVVIGQREAIMAVEEIVRQMDVQSEDQQDGFKSFRLKHLSAADAKVRLDTFFGQQNQGAGDNRIPSAPIVTIPDFRSNVITIKGSRQFILDAERFLKDIDVDKSESVNVVKVIQLRNTLAEELAVVIQDAINGQQANAGNGYKGANQQQQQQQQQNIQENQSSVGSRALSLQIIGANGAVVTSSGILFDVRVTADRNSNSLVVSAPNESMQLVENLIAQLDRLPNAETQIKVFQIANGDATTLLTTLQALFQSSTTQGQQGGQGGFGGGGQTGGNLSQLPLQGASATDGATLVNLRFGVDTRTNTIIASGPAGDLQVVEDLLNRLDENQLNEGNIKTFRLSNAPVLDVAEAINQWLTTRATINDTDPRAVGDRNQTNREVIVVPEVNSNTLIIQARPEYMAEIDQLILALDRRPPMVKVKVMIAEVDLDRLEEFGMDLGVQDSLMFDRGTSIGAGNAITGIGFPFNTSTAPNRNATFRETLAGQALSNLGTGRINNDLGYGGLVLSAGNESINILLRALKDKQCVRVLSKPQILTMENLQGRIQVGASVPRISGTTNSNFGVTQNITFVDVGVILEVTPRVSQDGMIVMAVVASKSAVGPDSTGITIAIGADGTPIRSPQIIETEAQTTLMARSGQTVVFSGLIQETKIHQVRGTPILSDLPLIGPLFRFEKDQASRSELLIVMTPYLVTDEQDVDTQNFDEMDRMHWCLCDVAEVYGNTDYDGYEGNETAVETIYPDSDPTGLQPQYLVPESSTINQ